MSKLNIWYSILASKLLVLLPVLLLSFGCSHSSFRRSIKQVSVNLESCRGLASGSVSSCKAALALRPDLSAKEATEIKNLLDSIAEKNEGKTGLLEIELEQFHRLEELLKKFLPDEPGLRISLIDSIYSRSFTSNISEIGGKQDSFSYLVYDKLAKGSILNGTSILSKSEDGSYKFIELLTSEIPGYTHKQVPKTIQVQINKILDSSSDKKLTNDEQIELSRALKDYGQLTYETRFAALDKVYGKETIIWLGSLEKNNFTFVYELLSSLNNKSKIREKNNNGEYKILEFFSSYGLSYRPNKPSPVINNEVMEVLVKSEEAGLSEEQVQMIKEALIMYGPMSQGKRIDALKNVYKESGSKVTIKIVTSGGNMFFVNELIDYLYKKGELHIKNEEGEYLLLEYFNFQT